MFAGEYKSLTTKVFLSSNYDSGIIIVSIVSFSKQYTVSLKKFDFEPIFSYHSLFYVLIYRNWTWSVLLSEVPQ